MDDVLALIETQYSVGIFHKNTQRL